MPREAPPAIREVMERAFSRRVAADGPDSAPPDSNGSAPLAGEASLGDAQSMPDPPGGQATGSSPPDALADLLATIEEYKSASAPDAGPIER
jgi:hypothetical protein